MKLIYITAKRYPGGTADHHYIENLARAFHGELGDNFRFVVRDTDPSALPGLPLIQLSIPSFLKRSIFFFFWIPFFWLKFKKEKGEQVVFFSNDQNLLAILIFWKKKLCLSYKVASDWHMLAESWKDKFIARNTDYSICTSQKLEKAVRKLSPWGNIYTVYGGVDLAPYHQAFDAKKMREELGLPKDKFLVSYVGLFMTMGMEKGIGTMIYALVHTDPDVVMVFVGGKPDEIERYEVQAKALKVFDKCIFLPVQTFEKVMKYEKAMDILVIPYPDKPHFRSYGFPMKIYEYMASGVPIIYTKLELLEEVVEDCAYGIAPDSPLELAQTISSIHSHYGEAKVFSSKALARVTKTTWKARAENIVRIFDIIPSMITIPNKSLKYILFQRTEFSVYTLHPWLLRIVMNKKIPFYNKAVSLEAILFKGRTKRYFSQDMDREYGLIKNFLPVTTENILDIGCGVGGIDIMLHKHYASLGKSPSFYLLDKTEVNSKVYYGIEKEAAFYNSLDTAKDLLMANGVLMQNIHTEEVTSTPFFQGKKFDLIISLISWGFHYPISMYIDRVCEVLNTGGTLIVDVRKDTEGERILKEKFGSFTVISEAQKYRRLCIKKK